MTSEYKSPLLSEVDIHSQSRSLNHPISPLSHHSTNGASIDPSIFPSSHNQDFHSGLPNQTNNQSFTLSISQSNDQSIDQSDDESTIHLLKKNIRPILKLASPIVLTYVLQYCLNLVNLIFIGHLSAVKLAGAALGNMAVSVTGYAIIYGFATSVDTLAAQAYGSGSYMLVGLVAQRACVLLAILCVPILIVWWFVTDILIACKQDPEISVLAGQYVWTLSYSLFAISWFEVLKKYLICQSKLKPLIFVLVITNGINALLVYLFIYHFEMDFVGGPMATMVSQWCMLIGTVGVCLFTGVHKKTWPKLSKDILTGWIPMIKLGIGGGAMMLAEWASFELCSFMAGWVGHIELDAFVALLQVQALLFMLPLGFGIAASTLIGNNLGAGRPHEAKWSGITAVVMTASIELVLILVFVIAIDGVSNIFTNDERVIELMIRVAPVTAAMLMFDGVQAVSSGLLRGVGLQKIGAVTNLLGYYMIGIPLGILMTFHYHLHVFGLVAGLLIAVAITSIVFVLTLWRVDWTKESIKAVERVKEEQAEAEHTIEQSSFDQSDQFDQSINQSINQINKKHEMLEMEQKSMYDHSLVHEPVIMTQSRYEDDEKF